jgi:WD40 repeat protein
LVGAVGAVWWYGVRDRPARLRARLDADLGAMLWDASADGKYLLTASFQTPGRGVEWYGHRSRVWDAATGKEVPIPGELFDAVAFTPDGKQLVVLSPSRLSLYDWAAGKETDEVYSARQVEGGQLPLRFFGFTPGGRQLIFAPPGDARMWFWDLAARKAVRTEFPTGTDPFPRPRRPIFVGGARQVVLTDGGNPERRTPRSVSVWSVDPPKKVVDLASGAGFFDPVLSPDGKWLAVFETHLDEAGRKDVVRVWDTADWAEATTLAGARSPHFTAGGRTLVTSGENPDRIVRWECGTWKPASTHTPLDSLSGPTIHPSPDGRWVAYSSARLAPDWEKRLRQKSVISQIRLLDVATGRDELLSDNACLARWLPDGRTLAVRGNRFTDRPVVELWGIGPASR